MGVPHTCLLGGSQELISEFSVKHFEAKKPAALSSVIVNILVSFADGAGGGRGPGPVLCQPRHPDTFARLSCLTYELLAPGSLGQETSGDTGSRHSGPECARQTMPDAPGTTPEKHAPGTRRTPNTTRSAA